MTSTVSQRGPSQPTAQGHYRVMAGSIRREPAREQRRRPGPRATAPSLTGGHTAEMGRWACLQHARPARAFTNRVTSAPVTVPAGEDVLIFSHHVILQYFPGAA